MSFKLLNRNIKYGGGDVHSVNITNQERKFTYEGYHILEFVKNKYLKMNIDC